MQTAILLWTTIAGLAALAFSGLLTFQVLSLPDGNDKMLEIANAIKTGANAYLWRQYKVVLGVAIIIFLILGYFLNWITGVGFLLGAFVSALSGYIGLAVAVRPNARPAEAARTATAIPM